MARARVFRSRFYGRMHKRRRREMGLAGFKREEVWARMATEEARIRALVGARRAPWWKRLFLALCGAVSRAFRPLVSILWGLRWRARGALVRRRAAVDARRLERLTGG